MTGYGSMILCIMAINCVFIAENADLITMKVLRSTILGINRYAYKDQIQCVYKLQALSA